MTINTILQDLDLALEELRKPEADVDAKSALMYAARARANVVNFSDQILASLQAMNESLDKLKG